MWSDNDWEDNTLREIGWEPDLALGHCAWPPSFHSDPPSPSCSVYSRIVHHLCDAEEPEDDQEGSVKVQQG